MNDYEELKCSCGNVIGIVRYFRTYYKQPNKEFCHPQTLGNDG